LDEKQIFYKSANFQNFNIFIFHPILMQFCFLQNTHFNELCLHHESIKKSTYLFLENGFKVLPGPRLHSSPVPSVSGTDKNPVHLKNMWNFVIFFFFFFFLRYHSFHHLVYYWTCAWKPSMQMKIIYMYIQLKSKFLLFMAAQCLATHSWSNFVYLEGL
jgi:hypothetical protein